MLFPIDGMSSKNVNGQIVIVGEQEIKDKTHYLKTVLDQLRLSFMRDGKLRYTVLIGDATSDVGQLNSPKSQKPIGN